MSQTFRHILLISIDDLRFDALSASPHRDYLVPRSLDSLPKTPSLDRLVHEGVAFWGCRSVSPLTPPSHASMLTGLYPQRTGVRVFFPDQLRSRALTLGERLSSAGMRTLSYSDFGPTLGFAKILRGTETCLSEAEMIDRFEQAHRSGESVFAFHHMGHVHSPYGMRKDTSKVDPEFRELLVDLYQSKVHPLTRAQLKRFREKDAFYPMIFDHVFRRFCNHPEGAEILLPLYLAGVNHFDRSYFRGYLETLESRGLLEDTLVVITADHGEAPASGQTAFGHGADTCDEVLRVPLIFWSKRFAGSLAGKAFDLPVSTIDIAPTLLSLQGLGTAPGELDGKDRSALLDPASKNAERSNALSPSECYAEVWEHDQTFWDRIHSVLKFLSAEAKVDRVPRLIQKRILRTRTIRTGSLKYNWDSALGENLTNTDADPGERHNLLRHDPLLSRLTDLSGLPAYHRTAQALRSSIRRIDANGKTSRQAPRLPTNEARSLQKSLRKLGYTSLTDLSRGISANESPAAAGGRVRER